MALRRTASAAWTALLGALALLLALFAIVHAVADDRQFGVALVHAGIGWALAPAVPLAGIALVTARRRIAGIAAGVAALHLVWVAPGHLAALLPTPTGATVLRIGSANLLWVNPTADRHVGVLLDLGADVWCLQELTPDYAARLTQGEAARRWPHRHLDPDGDSSFGVGIVSRWRLVGGWTEDLGGVPVGLAIVAEGPAAGTAIVCVHTVPPRNRALTAQWSAQMDALTRRVAAFDRPVLLVGDLNATRHHPAYRRLLAGAGVHDAHAEVGRSTAWTWPAPPYRHRMPPIRLDHVLPSIDLRAVRVMEGPAAGSDHRPVVADLAWATGPAVTRPAAP